MKTRRRDAGMDDFLTKPLRSADAAHALLALAARGRTRARASSRAHRDMLSEIEQIERSGRSGPLSSSLLRCSFIVRCFRWTKSSPLLLNQGLLCPLSARKRHSTKSAAGHVGANQLA